jgi:heme-degrading monooxygenase HmoA
VVTFADEASHDAWRRQVDHVAAQRKGRSDYYAEYSLQVCQTLRVRGFEGSVKVDGADPM